MSRVCKIVLVCEGWRDSAFARAFLAESIDPRSIDNHVNPGGSGHDWVKTQFVNEVANLIRFSEGRGVIGLLDEDGVGVTARTNEVSNQLNQLGLPSISPQDGRCLLLPTRNLETWLYWLSAYQRGISAAVDEMTDYKKTGPPNGVARIGDTDCKPAGQCFHGLNHNQLPAGCPPMLAKALEQLRDFVNAVRIG